MAAKGSCVHVTDPPVTDCKGFLARIDHTTPNKEMNWVRVGDGLRRYITQPPLTLTLPLLPLTEPTNMQIPGGFLLAAAGFGISHPPPPLATEPAGLAVWRIFCEHQTFDGFYTRMFSGFLCTLDRFVHKTVWRIFFPLEIF
jgi:hypothetical protein